VELDKIYQGDATETLKTFPDGFVDCCVTSPPYFGLRDYGTANWEGGDESCEHSAPQRHGSTGLRADRTFTAVTPCKDECANCGAKRADLQVGLEQTPEEFVAKLVDVFREVRRVLKDDGTLWLNLGDSWAGGGGYSPDAPSNRNGRSMSSKQDAGTGAKTKGIKPTGDVKAKDLVGIPWMFAFALRADGWYLRQDIIWHKPNPMPESVTDRPTKSHEYIFLLSKSANYFYDHEAIKEKAASDRARGPALHADAVSTNGNAGLSRREPDGTRNKRSVWTVTTKPFAGAHFATFPHDLIIPCILAGSRRGGVVLDPFSGAGTTALVSRALARRFVGTELNPEYIAMANERVAQELPKYRLMYKNLLKAED
jgi:DNA modification methylase